MRVQWVPKIIRKLRATPPNDLRYNIVIHARTDQVGCKQNSASITATKMKTSISTPIPAKRCIIPAILFIAAVALSAGPRPRFQLTDLGTLPGAGPGGIPYAINDQGDVVGAAPDRNRVLRPFLYRNGAMIDPRPGTSGPGEALAINAAGQIITKEYIAPNLHYFLVSNGAAVDISPSSGRTFAVYNLNADGLVVGAYSPGDAFTWREGAFALLERPADASISVALDINGAGLIAGVVRLPSSLFALDSYRATLFREGQPAEVLGLPAGAVGATARAINDSGDVAGDAYYDPYGEGQSRAFLYSGGEFRDLGVLPGDVVSNGFDVNNSGQVVGISQVPQYDVRAFLYSEGELYDLNDLVKHIRGWHLRTAYAINNRGQIVGIAVVEGIERPYLLTPIRPGRSE